MAKRDPNTKFRASVTDGNYTTKTMNEFTILNNEELRNMEEIMKFIKNNKKAG